MFFKSTSIANLSDSNDELYEAELARRCAKAETLLWQQEEKERLERQAWKEAKIVEQKRLEEEAWKKKEAEAQSREEECQRELAHRFKADRVATVKKQCRKNWTKTFLPLTTPSSDEEMNLIDLPPLTKKQRVRYLLQETLQACQQCEKLAREIGTLAFSGGSPCERCTDFGILCISQNLP